MYSVSLPQTVLVLGHSYSLALWSARVPLVSAKLAMIRDARILNNGFLVVKIGHNAHPLTFIMNNYFSNDELMNQY